MNCSIPFQELVKAGACSTDQAMACFDSLEPVNLDFMLGRWRGRGVDTGHPMDGLLELFNWHGKEFISPEAVHPLVFNAGDGTLIKLDPRWMSMQHARNTALTRHPFTQRLFRLATLLIRTNAPKARLRMIEFRGKVSAAMLYDDLPINDVFHRIDDDTVLGVMDLKGMQQPFFFLLERER